MQTPSQITDGRTTSTGKTGDTPSQWVPYRLERKIDVLPPSDQDAVRKVYRAYGYLQACHAADGLIQQWKSKFTA